MKPYTIRGITFNANDEGEGAFNCFHPDFGTDRGAHGMIEEARAFIEITKNMRSLLDVGALFGLFSLLFTRNPKARAIAIEPSDMAYPILLEHCKANPAHDIVPKQIFVGDTQGRTVDCARDWKHIVGNLNRPEAERLEMRESRLDDIIFGSVDCMKIDVEAYECQVLRGAERLIRRWRPIIFLEAHCNTLADNGETPESLMDILAGFEYVVRDYQDNLVNSFDGFSMTRAVCWPN